METRGSFSLSRFELPLISFSHSRSKASEVWVQSDKTGPTQTAVLYKFCLLSGLGLLAFYFRERDMRGKSRGLVPHCKHASHDTPKSGGLWDTILWNVQGAVPRSFFLQIIIPFNAVFLI